MNYCSINEAWGQANYISKQFNKVNKVINNSEKVIRNKKKHIEKFTNSNKVNKNKVNPCNSFITHMKTCSHCRNKMREHFKPKIVENFEDIIQNNRDVIVLILIGLCFMIFFNMLMNVTSK
jgi:predicted  nucleic acid-binding Zn-ribbon protein